MRRMPMVLCAMVLVVVAAAAARAEQVEDPRYAAWKDYAIGSSASYETETAAGGQKMLFESTHKLLEKADDHVTVEVTTSYTIDGAKHSVPPQKQNIAAKSEKKNVAEKESEDVKAAGKTYTCKVYEVKETTPTNGKEVTAKVWVSKDVPGGMVKMEASTDQGKVTSTLKSSETK